jgi:short-subunit dehydrogenase
MVRDLRDLRLLITGASSGIGRCLAEQAARAGARVALVARSPGPLEAAAAELARGGHDALAVAADVTEPAGRQRVLNTVTARFGGLDVLVNNAGVGSWGHFSGGSEVILRQVMEVNFFAAAELTRLAIPTLTAGRQPAVLNIASMCGRRGMPAWSEYSASKFALCGLTEALRGELARFDIAVLLVVPGLTRSDLARHLLRSEGRYSIPYEKGMPPENVASAALEALRRNRTETVVGSDARWMLRVNRFVPRLVDRLLARRVRKLYTN